MKINIASLLLLTLFLLSTCKPEVPVDYEMNGAFKCHYCRMGIVDPRFRGQVLTKKGRLHKFDSLECLLAHQLNQATTIESAYVANFQRPQEWLPLEKAVVLHSKKLISPMGAGLSAYANQEDLKQSRKLYSGAELEQKDVAKFIQAWAQKLRVK